MTKRSTALTTAVFALIAVAAVPAGAAVGPSTCTSKKLKASGKDAFKMLNCYAKAVKTGSMVDSTCLSDEDTKLSDAFTSADGFADCVNGTGAGTIGPKVSTFVGN